MLKWRSGVLSFYLNIIMLLFALIIPAQVSSAPKNELETKASCILNFTIFVEWPKSFTSDSKNSSPLNICVFGNNPIFQTLNSHKGKDTITNRVNILTVNNADNITNCHIVFIGSANAADIPTLLIQLVNKPVLTISDQQSFNKNGGIIEFIVKDNMVRFKINNEAARKAGLLISSQLLELTEEK